MKRGATAEVLSTTLTEAARPAGRRQPGNTDPVSLAKARALSARASHVAHHLMTGNHRCQRIGKIAVDHVQVGEPIFIPESTGREEDGWLISECLDGDTAKTFFALIAAGRLGDGPRALLHLSHHVPLSFHGCWVSRAA